MLREDTLAQTTVIPKAGISIRILKQPSMIWLDAICQGFLWPGLPLAPAEKERATESP
jgi:hypothetical protein